MRNLSLRLWRTSAQGIIKECSCRSSSRGRGLRTLHEFTQILINLFKRIPNISYKMCFLAQYDYFLFVFIQRTDVYTGIIIMITCLLMAMLGNGIEIK